MGRLPPSDPAGAARHQEVRQGVRALLTAAEGFGRLDPARRRDLAHALVRISASALDLAAAAGSEPPSPAPRPVAVPLARVQSAGFDPGAVAEIAPQTEQILNAVSFPRFVGELITGVFKAMNESNEQQLESYVALIRNVAATTEGFAEANIGPARARAWLVERFPGRFRIIGGGDPGFDRPDEMTPEDRAVWEAEQAADQRLELAPGAEMPSQAALRMALGAEDLPERSDPEALVGLARAHLARNRQAMLATMVKMGLQRIVIDGGRLNAAMRFHIDAESQASEDRASRFDLRNELSAQASARFGPWGGAASLKNTIGYVSTEVSQREQALNAELDLDSSVELVFRTDQVPLNRLAGAGAVQRISDNALNPEAERGAAQARRQARRSQRDSARATRRSGLIEQLRPPDLPTDAPDPGVESYGPRAEQPTSEERASGGEAAGAAEAAPGAVAEVEEGGDAAAAGAVAG